MKNKILSTTRNTIPYVKELKQLKLVKSVAAAVLMQQLDYWFNKYPDGFYKFMQPCPSHKAYKEGDSWAEELAFSSDEFWSAFDSIGKRHTSKTAWEETNDPFEGSYYCSYHDKKEGLTWYFRNHNTVDLALEILYTADSKPSNAPKSKPLPVNGQSQSTGNGQSQSTEMGKANLQRWAKSIYRDGQSQSPYLYTETTPEITSEITHTPPSPPEEEESGSVEAEVIEVETEASIKQTPQRSVLGGSFPLAHSLAIAVLEQPKPQAKPVDPFLASKRRHNPNKGTQRSCKDDPWMESDNNPLPIFKEWVFASHKNAQKNLSEHFRTYTPSLANAAAEIRNDYARAADLWAEFVVEMEQRVEAFNHSVSAGLKIADTSWEEIKAIAPYSSIPVAKPPALIQGSGSTTSVSSLPGENAQAYRDFVPPAIAPSSLETAKTVMVQVASKLAMRKPKQKEPADELEEKRRWLTDPVKELRDRAVRWAYQQDDVEIVWGDTGNAVDLIKTQAITNPTRT